MAKQRQSIQDLVGLLHVLYPPELAEDWDNVGLQVGDPAAPLERVLVALDPVSDALRAAVDAGAQALVTHHPLLFRPISRLTPHDAVGEVIWQAVRSGVAVISVHTNLDSAADGLNRWLAELLGVERSEPLQPAPGNFLKLVVYVPTSHVEQLSTALFSVGAGQVGAYDECSFKTVGSGTFRPGAETRPFIGEPGRSEQVEEIRFETIVPRRCLARVLEKMLKVHPYEEVAYDLLPLENRTPDAGLGRIGRLVRPLSLEAFVGTVKERLDCSQLRLAGRLEREVSKVAVCGGSGAGLLQTAQRQGADVLVTGDVKYHEARQAEELGIALIDAGHFGTEKLMIGRVAAKLAEAASRRRWPIEFESYAGEREPFRHY
jgi:dinuclear metal center YbgI/SA1388 family protein